MRYLLRLVVCMVSLCVPLSAFAEDADIAKAKSIENSVQADGVHGKVIFDAICTHCHRIDYKLSAVGCPGLKDVLDRHDAAWLNDWLLSPEAFAKKNEDAKLVVQANPYGLVMPTIPEMQDEQNRKDVIEYLKTLK